MKKHLISTLLMFSTFAAAAEPLFFSVDMQRSHIREYTEEEKAAIDRDLSVIEGVCFTESQTSQKRPVYLATAGGPGARKTTILERFLKNEPGFVYLDPDQRGLKFMVHTYHSRSLANYVLAQHEHYSIAQKAAYEKWKGASNYITLALLEKAFAEGKSIAHGTTSTGGHMSQFLERVKQAGYRIDLLLCYAPDGIRERAVHYRNEEQKFYQSTPEDAVSKGKLFPQRMPAYFTHADTLYLYWSDDYTSEEQLGALLKDGMLQIIDGNAYRSFVKKYEKDREALMKEGITICPWNDLIDLYCKR